MAPESIKLNLIGEYDLPINWHRIDSKWDTAQLKDIPNLFPQTHVVMYGGNGIILFHVTTEVYLSYQLEKFDSWVVSEKIAKGNLATEWELPYSYELDKARSRYLEIAGFEDYLKPVDVEEPANAAT